VRSGRTGLDLEASSRDCLECDPAPFTFVRHPITHEALERNTRMRRWCTAREIRKITSLHGWTADEECAPALTYQRNEIGPR
jgi:hypothetical protein